MKGDFSRLRFDPAKQYDAVLMQQGRVALDADMNEASAIALDRDRRTTRDVIGPAGAPLADAGFAITLEPGGKLGIGPGTLYVDGIRCVNPAKFLHDAQPFLPPAEPVFLNPPTAPAAAPANGRYIAFVDVWHRHVTGLEDPAIVEEALGVDTTTRLQIIEQVRFLRAGNAGDAAISCDAPGPAWTTLITPPTGTLAARGKPADLAANPCAFPETAGYQRLENHLYRIEVHQSGTPGSGATFKWSRDNAAFATRWLSSNGNDLMLADIGRDAQSGLKRGQWIELTDEDRELAGRSGTLVQIADLMGQRVTIDPLTADGPTAFAGFGRNPKIRAWDSLGAVAVTVPGTNQGFLPIESGLEVAFAATLAYRAGDYWLVAARSGSGIDWPTASGVPVQQRAFGVEHGYARLALLDVTGGTWTLAGDCRPLFPPLTEMRQLALLGGDGQEVPPNPLLPSTPCPLALPLRVGVFRGTAPVSGARVRLRILSGTGQLNSIPPAAAASSIIVSTNAQGEASASWSLDAVTAAQTVRAELLDSAGTVIGLPVTFGASLSHGERVAFDPTSSPSLAGIVTVQDAIEELAKRTGGGCVEVTLSPESDWGKILTDLPKGRDTTICFRQGRFSTDKKVVVEGLGHVVVHGGGPATTLVGGGETVIEFANCESVAIRELAISAAEDLHDREGGRNGALSVTGCPSVALISLDVRCGASLGDERTCITVRAAEPKEGEAVQSLNRVEVNDCQIQAGFGQGGLLITDALDTLVIDNVLTVSPLPEKFKFEELIADPKRLGLLAKQLARDFSAAGEVEGREELKGAFKVGKFAVRAGDTIPTAEWEAQIASNPPTTEDTADVAAVEAYVKKITLLGIESTGATSTAFRATAGTMRRIMTNNAIEATAEAIGDLVRGGEIMVVEGIDQEEAPEARITLPIGDYRVAFESVIDSDSWLKIAEANRERLSADSQSKAEDEIADLTKLLILDEQVRSGVPDVEKWYMGLKRSLATVGAQGITIAGSTGDHVCVTRNSLRDFAEGVHVALSREGDGRTRHVAFGSVVVTGNRMRVRMPFERLLGGYALLVGNAGRVRINDNDIDGSEGGKKRRPFADGIRVWGYLGDFIHIIGNAISIARTGIRVVDVDPPTRRSPVQWQATNNHAPGSADAVVAPSRMLVENNTP